jgi:F-type H+-transporting ATPase subunit c
MNRRFVMMALALVTVALFAAPAMAQEAGAAPTAGGGIWAQFLGAALAIGIAAAAGGIGQGLGIKAACEAMGRNPGAAGPVRITMIIGLALIESLVIYSLIIAFIILSK